MSRLAARPPEGLGLDAEARRSTLAAKSEAYTAEQRSLLDETCDTDLAALALEIEQQQPSRLEDKTRPRRAPLPSHLPRREIRHEPASTTSVCGWAMKRIGEDVAEKLDYEPGVFTVERHIRGKWVASPWQEIELSRRKLVLLSHPRHVVGMVPEPQETVRTEARRINAAYAVLSAARARASAPHRASLHLRLRRCADGDVLAKQLGTDQALSTC